MGINTFEPIYIPNPNKKKAPSLLGIIITMFIFPPISFYLIFKKILHAIRGKRYADFKNYAAFMGRKPYVHIEDIASVMGKSVDVVCFDIQSMINKGYLGREAYIDRGEGILYIRQSRADEYEENYEAPRPRRAKTVTQAQTAPKQAESKQTAPKQEAPKQNAGMGSMNEFEGILNRIRELNEQIADGPVSEKIDRIGVLTAGIFAIVQMKPERRDEVNKFMNYYLPTTFKLLEMYALMEKQGYQSQSIIESRGKIRDMLDMLIQAFEKQQDILFKSDVLDLDCDIDVLETMMAADGLVLPDGSDIERFKTQTMN